MNPPPHTLSLGTMFGTSGTQEDGNLATHLQGLPWETCSVLIACAHQLQNIAPLDQFTGATLINWSSGGSLVVIGEHPNRLREWVH